MRRLRNKAGLAQFADAHCAAFCNRKSQGPAPAAHLCLGAQAVEEGGLGVVENAAQRHISAVQLGILLALGLQAGWLSRAGEMRRVSGTVQ